MKTGYGSPVKHMRRLDQCPSSCMVVNGQILVMGTRIMNNHQREVQMSSHKGRVRELVAATLKTYEGLDEARAAVRNLYPMSTHITIVDPRFASIVKEGETMHAGAMNMVHDAGFRSRKEGETNTEWLRAFLTEVQ